MDSLFFAHLFNGLLMIAMPVGLGIFLVRWWKTSGRIWWIGAATFVLSQVGHIPFNWGVGKLLNLTGMVNWDPRLQLIFNALFLGLSAGLFEEMSRYLVLLLWAKDARSWRKGVLFGAGHGGAEAILLGILVMYTFIQMVALRNNNLPGSIPANQLNLAQRQVLAYWSTTWYDSMLGVVERMFTIICQIAMATMVMKAFTSKRIRWLFAAIGFHTSIDASAVLGARYINVYWVEAIILGFAIISLILIFILREPEPMPLILDQPDGTVAPTILIDSIEETQENLEKTRYQS